MKKLVIAMFVLVSGLMAQRYYCATTAIVDAVTLKTIKTFTKKEMEIDIIGKDGDTFYDSEEVFQKYDEQSGLGYYKSEKGNIIIAKELSSGNIVMMFKLKNSDRFLRYYCMPKEVVDKKIRK